MSARPLQVIALSCVLATLGACTQVAPDEEMKWAEQALKRNADVQILSIDRQARSFTVRLKASGELRIVQANAIVGGLPGEFSPVRTVASAAAAAPENPEPPASATPAPSSNGSRPEVSAPPASAAIASGPGVLAAGPGYSIRSARADNSVARVGSSPANDISRGAALERRDEPIVCQGARFLRIDGRNLEFKGDAITAEDGCEIHITNSHIIATGVGVSARAASVHIQNSAIEGDAGAILASDGAQVYAQASRFRGLRRGLTADSLHDLGGNVWN